MTCWSALACGGRSTSRAERCDGPSCHGAEGGTSGGGRVADGGRSTSSGAGGAGDVTAGRGGSSSGATGGTGPSPAGGEGGRAEDGGESGADTAGAPNGGTTAGMSGSGGSGGTANAPNDAGAPGEGGAPSEPSCDGPGARFITNVIEHAFGTGQNFNQGLFPNPIFGPPEANQTSSVVSLGNGGFVTLAFAGNAIVDGPGADFLVFENPLPSYVELATVAVSEDGLTWSEFPCSAPDEDTESVSDFGSCAGVRPVYASSSNGIDPLDSSVAGGDAFDLADLGLSRAQYVRITDRADLHSTTGGVFDLDAVGILNAECP